MNELSTHYRRKIKTVEELRAMIGGRPRTQTVVMCHGVFDLVHPGHIRHLLYAKGKANILIASLTADVHINKAQHRPFVPQDLRALNLAALETVDYVIIDENATPLDNIAALQENILFQILALADIAIAKGKDLLLSFDPPDQLDVVFRSKGRQPAA